MPYLFRSIYGLPRSGSEWKRLSEIAAQMMGACEKKRRFSMGNKGMESINTDAGQARYEVGG